VSRKYDPVDHPHYQSDQTEYDCEPQQLKNNGNESKDGSDDFQRRDDCCDADDQTQPKLDYVHDL